MYTFIPSVKHSNIQEQEEQRNFLSSSVFLPSRTEVSLIFWAAVVDV